MAGGAAAAERQRLAWAGYGPGLRRVVWQLKRMAAACDPPLPHLPRAAFSETLELAGVQPERVAAELAAQERAKQQRLYGGHHTAPPHPAAPGAPAPPAAAAAPAAAAPAVSASSAAGKAAGPCSSQEGSGQAQPCASPGAAAAGSGCTLLGPAEPGAPEPPRGSAEWVAAQAAYEDAHLGLFERVMPPADPEQVEWLRLRKRVAGAGTRLRSVRHEQSLAAGPGKVPS